MLSQTDAGGKVTKYEYNVANKVVKKIYQEKGSNSSDNIISYTYNPDGTLKESIDRNGNITKYNYDIHGRLISKVVKNTNKTESITIKYTYDNNGNILVLKDSTGDTIRTYNELNEVTSKVVPNIGKTTYEYGVISGISALKSGYYAEITTNPNNSKVIKIYDKNGRLEEVRDENNITKYSYYDNGNLKLITLPNGFKVEYKFNKDNTLQKLINKDSKGNILEEYTYTYDGCKNITSKLDSKGVTTYEYDNLNRLAKVVEPTKTTIYSYDGSGNRSKEEVTKDSVTTIKEYSYDSNNRLLKIVEVANGVKIEKTSYNYDNNGNQLSSTVTNYIGTVKKAISSYKYNLLNELIECKIANGLKINYEYNGEGLRVSKESNGKIVRYLYEGKDVILEVDGNNKELARSVKGTSYISRTIGNEVLYYMYNGHADVTLLSNGSGEVVAKYYYDAFGEIIESSGSADNPIRYAGYQYDEETGLYYLNARMYDPTIARFLQEDTYTGDIKDPLSLNLYTYCHNNPLVYYDPTGHSIFGSVVNFVGKTASYIGRGISGLLGKDKKSSSKTNSKKSSSKTNSKKSSSKTNSKNVFNQEASLDGKSYNAIDNFKNKANQAKNIFTMSKGRKAHSIIQADFMLGNINLDRLVEVPISGIKENKSGKGRADMIIREYSSTQVFEIKPISYKNKPYLNKKGKNQLNKYINALNNNGETAMAGVGWNPKKVYPFDSKTDLVIVTDYANDPGMIYYDFKAKQPKQQEVVVTEKAKEKEEESNKLFGYICVGAGVGIGILTVAEDIFTGGAGIADDPASFGAAGELIRRGFSMM